MSPLRSVTWGTIETALRARRDEGRKLLVPYVTGGLGPDWLAVVEAVASAGADAVEVGIPFSDPVMDGPVIQEASQRALAAGITPAAIVTALGKVDTGGVPIAVMTYYNLVFRAGHTRFARSLAEQGVAGAIVPDLPLDELDGWGDAAAEAGVETILLAAPTTPDDRLAAICERIPGLGLRDRDHGRHRRAGGAGRVGHPHGQAAQGRHRQAGAHRHRRVHPRPRRRRRRPTPTGSSWARPWSAACSRASGPTVRPTSWPSSGPASTPGSAPSVIPPVTRSRPGCNPSGLPRGS